MNSQGRMKLKIWGALIAVFALGCMTGASIDGIFRLKSQPGMQASVSEQQPQYPSMRDTDAYFETLKRELSLSTEQSSRMRQILERTREDYKAICADVRPNYDRLRETARNEMRTLLSADQQQRFDMIVTAEDCRCPELKK